MQNNRINVMYIFNDTAFGGAGQSLIDTIVEIRNEMNLIVVIREDSTEIVCNKFNELNIRYHKIFFLSDFAKIGNVSENDRKADMRQSYEAALQLLSIIKKENIQLIHINSSVSYFAALAALMAHIPYVWHIRELMDEHYGCETINEALKRNLLEYADKVIAISDYVKQRYLVKYHIHTLKIYNGLKIEKYKLDINANMEFQNVFLVAGTISPEKGQWDAIRAVEILIERGYLDLQLIIVGANGEGYVWALNKYISRKKLDKNISILPFQNDLSELHRKASYAINCSQNEALGRVTIEAMLAGNIVIGARSGGTIEIVGENEERGFLYELHNSESLADAMIRAIKCSKITKNQMLQRAQTFAEETFDSRKYCRNLVNVYHQVISTFKPKDQDIFLDEIQKKYETIKNIKQCENQKINIGHAKSAAALALAMKWIEIKQKGYNLEEYFKKNGYQKIAIYGMAELGRRLYDELEHGDIEVKYLIDRNINKMDLILEFVSLEEEKIEVDVIVVTVALTERQVIDEIKEKGYQKVVGLSEILNSFT